jgi:hypothetical protein
MQKPDRFCIVFLSKGQFGIVIANNYVNYNTSDLTFTPEVFIYFNF